MNTQRVPTAAVGAAATASAAAGAALWTITLLGSMVAVPPGQRQSRAITRFRTHKYGALLGYLAFHINTLPSRERVIALLWPQMNEKAGRNNLSVALSSLRNQLEPPGTPKGAVIVADRFHVGLNAESVTTDVARFEEALRLAEETSSALERGQYLSRAIDLYRGPLLRGYDEEWIAGERERLSGLFLHALAQRIRDLEAGGDPSSALSHARKAVMADPLREEGQTHLIRLLAATGDTEQAQRQFREFERLLQREMGDEPSPSLWNLVHRIETKGEVAAPQPRVLRTRSAPSHLEPTLSKSSGETKDTGFDSRDTLTFLLMEITDETPPYTGDEPLRSPLEICRHLVREAVSRYGSEAAESDEGFTAVFSHAGAALSCAVQAQKYLQSFHWPEGTGPPPRIRMTLHTGDVEVEAGPLREQVLHRAARMLTAAHAGQVLLSEATASLVRGFQGNDGDIYLVDLGLHRLRDVQGAEHLFQVNYPGMDPTAFPPLAVEPGAEANLPATVTRFFGRESEIARLTQMLRNAQLPLVTLTGTGGTGKTRLAIEAVRQMVPHFGGAVFFVPLAGISDHRLIPDVILQGLRLPRSPQRDPLDQAVEALKKQPTLLLLDNLEHIIGGGTTIVAALLSAVPDLTVLVTSRQVLDLPAGREFALSPLPTPGEEDAGGRRTPEELSRFDSVALFLDRAQGAKPDFQITEHNAAALAMLCDRLEGIPLAIELAAARAQVLTPAQMLAQLSDRFAFLTSRRKGVEERLRTLRGAIDWSYHLLSPDLQRFFCRLSVFRGGWTAEAAAAVCEEPEHGSAVSGLALDYLAQLQAASLVLSEETEQAGSGGTMRFRMLETLREYGEEQLSDEKVVLLRQRHLSFFLSLSETPDGWDYWSDVENVRAGLDWSLGERGDPKAGLRLAAALFHGWWYAGLLREGDTYLAALLSRKETSAPDNGRAKALAGRAWILVRLGRLSEACSLYEETLSIYRQVDDQKGVAETLNTLADTLRMLGRHEQSRAMQEESLSLFQELGDPQGISYAFRDLGDLAIRLGDFAQARRFYQKSDEAIGGMNAMTPLRLAEIALFEGDYDKARQRGEEQVVLRRSSPQRCGEAFLIVGAASLYQGDLMTARSAFAEALRRFDDIGSRLFLPRTLRLFSYLAIRKEEWNRAARLLSRDEVICQELETPLPPCERSEYDRNRAAVRAALGDADFNAAWEAGRALSWEEAVAFALEGHP